MLIDRSHRNWIIACASVFGLGILAYGVWRHAVPERPIGNTPLGLTFGVSAFAIMIFESLLGVRKALPAWRIGRLETWMVSHLWLGFAAAGLVCLHTGLRRGGVMTTSMLVLFSIVVGTGIFGALVQHFIPRIMTANVPFETVYEQIDRVRGQLVEEADDLMEAVTKREPISKASAAIAGTSADASPSAATAQSVGDDALSKFYKQEMRPYIARTGSGEQRLAHSPAAESVFRQLRVMSAAAVHPVIDDLEGICEEKRQLDRQRTLHHWLHCWMLVHGPLALALLTMIAAHAFMALRY